MSGAAQASSNSSTTKAVTNDASHTPQNPPQKPSAQLEEDDEFEDFPVEDWADEETDLAGGEASKHLWEESWDDDDTSEDFAQMLKEEMKKVEAAKQGEAGKR